MNHPITAILLIIIGTIGYTYVSFRHKINSYDIDNMNFKGYASSLGFLIIGIVILINHSILVAGITLTITSLLVFAFSVTKKRIGAESKTYIPNMMTFVILMFLSGMTLIIGNLFE